MGLMLTLFTGCVSSFDKFVTQPKDMIGYGVDNSWMWQDASKLGNTMVKSGVNITSIDLFGCNQTDKPEYAPVGKWGYWFDHFDEMKPYLNDFLNAMKKRKITVCVSMIGWNYRNGYPDPQNGNRPSTVCSVRFNADWFNKILQYFKDRGTDGIILETASEPGVRNNECMSKFYQFNTMVASGWGGMKSWNLNGRPNSAPPGFFIKYHPNNINEQCPANSIILTDGPAGAQISGGDPLKEIKLNKSVAIPYIKRLHQQGKGFIFYGWCFNGDWIDEDGIKAMGEAVK